MAFNPPGAGDMRWKVRFDRRASADDGAGNTRGDWAELIAERRARLTPTRGGEAVIGDRLAGGSAFDLVLYADAEVRGVRPSDRVVDISDPASPRIFDIRFAEVMDVQQRWVLMQVEAVQGKDGRG